MDFLFNAEQKELKKKVIKLCEEKLAPLEQKVGESKVMSREIAAVLAESGLFKLFVPAKYGNPPPCLLWCRYVWPGRNWPGVVRTPNSFSSCRDWEATRSF